VVCCVLTAAILAYIGSFFRRLVGRSEAPTVVSRPPAPTPGGGRVHAGAGA